MEGGKLKKMLPFEPELKPMSRISIVWAAFAKVNRLTLNARRQLISVRPKEDRSLTFLCLGYKRR